jgi:DNA-directed RNA polymerase subunit RPC12/RpoP
MWKERTTEIEHKVAKSKLNQSISMFLISCPLIWVGLIFYDMSGISKYNPSKHYPKGFTEVLNEWSTLEALFFIPFIYFVFAFVLKFYTNSKSNIIFYVCLTCQKDYDEHLSKCPKCNGNILRNNRVIWIDQK